MISHPTYLDSGRCSSPLLLHGGGASCHDRSASPPWALERSYAIGKLIRALWSHKYWMLFIGILGLAAGYGAGFVQEPVYQAKALIEMEGINENYFNIRDAAPTLPSYAAEGYVQTQVRLLQTDALLLRVASILKLEENANGHQSGPFARIRRLLHLAPARVASPEDALLNRIREQLTVRTAVQSSIIEISYRSKDSELAATFPNTLAREYIRESLEQRWTTAQDTTERLTQQMTDLKGRLETASRGLEAYASNSGLTLTGARDKESLAEDRIRQLQAELSRANADRVAAQALYETARSAPENSIPPTMIAISLGQYQVTLSGLRRQLAEVSTSLTPAHPKREKIEAQIAETEEAIRLERVRVMNRLKEDYESARERERMFEASCREQAKIVMAEAPRLAQYNILKREVETTQALYDSMLQKAREAGIVSALRGSNMRVVDPARPPSIPSFPNYSLNCGVGLLTGLLLSTLVVVVRDTQNRSLRMPGDVTRIINVPELGVIPSADLAAPRRALPSILKSNRRQLELITWNEKPSLLAESFRVTLASLLFSGPGDERLLPFPAAGHNRPGVIEYKGIAMGRKVIVVTSLRETEGKTTVVSNLAIALAQTNRRVLLIDADVRRPRLHEIFDVPTSNGLVDFLTGAASIAGAPPESLGASTSIPNIWVMPGGQGSEDISSLFFMASAAQLLNRVRKEFDIVLIDTPPLLAFSDARALGRVSDGIILVVRANKTTPEELATGFQRLVEDQTPVIGTILNDWNPRTGGLYAYGTAYGRYGL